MWEKILVIATVLGAALWVGYTLYRRATGKSGCAGCSGCALNPKPSAKTRGTCPADHKSSDSTDDN